MSLSGMKPCKSKGARMDLHEKYMEEKLKKKREEKEAREQSLALLKQTIGGKAVSSSQRVTFYLFRGGF